MSNKLKFFALLVCALFAFSACSDDDDNNGETPGGGGNGNGTETPGEIKTVEFLDVKSYTDWVYFSFKKNEVVAVTDYANDMNWDIAFHRGDVRLNGGKSGKGKGAVVQTSIKNWDEVTEAPTTGYIADEIGTITTAFTGDGVTTAEQPFSKTLTGWLTVDTSNPPPKYTINGYIYVLKAADGNYVKLSLYDNKNEKNAAGYVSFKYQYNASGTAKFK